MSLITDSAELVEEFVACDYDEGVHDAQDSYDQFVRSIVQHIPILKGGEGRGRGKRLAGMTRRWFTLTSAKPGKKATLRARRRRQNNLLKVFFLIVL